MQTGLGLVQVVHLWRVAAVQDERVLWFDILLSGMKSRLKVDGLLSRQEIGAIMHLRKWLNVLSVPFQLNGP